MTGVQPVRQRLGSVALAVILVATLLMGIGAPAGAVADDIVDDFENELPSGTDSDSVPIGFYTFAGIGSIDISTEAPPVAVPDSAAGNNALRLDLDVENFAGVIHGFEDGAVANWVPQDWSTREGISFWFYGTNSNTPLFLDILENRNAGSTKDDAQRWTVEFTDNFAGWQLLQFPFASFVEKPIGNGAPTDGFDRFDVHGWAIGTLDTGGPRTFYVDDVGLYGEVDPPALTVGFASTNFDIAEGATGEVTVRLNRPMNADDPSEVSVDYVVEELTPIPGREYIPVSGTLTFNGDERAQTFSIQTFDDGKYEPDERLLLRLLNPVSVGLGSAQATATIVDNDPFDALLLDDFELDPYLWTSSGANLASLETEDGSPASLPGQGPFEGVLRARAAIESVEIQGNLCKNGNGVIPVVIYSTEDFDATALDHTTLRLGEAAEFQVDRRTGEPRKRVEDANRDGLLDLVLLVRANETGVDCDSNTISLFDSPAVTGGTFAPDTRIGRDFPVGQDWRGSDSLSFWFLGQGSGEDITFELLDNRAPDPGPAGWTLAWSDEFNEGAGTAPNPDNWGYEHGDGSVNGIPGWGNSELQFYTDSPDNVAMDGEGHLVITAQEADGELCYYGPCDYTSARLVSKNRAEFAYGRIEARILAPDGEAGLWPAFWSLGTDIDQVGWPQTGEIDVMEYVSRNPNEVFGTVHGPGYSGGQAFGSIFDFGAPVADDYRTYVIEWEPDLIKWYVDGNFYHEATPEDVPGEWVFNDPVYLLLNLALGGNFGGELSPDLTFPQEMKVDYVRVYQAPDSAERFEATFVDDFEGWQLIELPFEDFSRDADQSDGAPDDGLTLSEVWGYGLSFESDTSLGEVQMDQIRLVDDTPPTVWITDDVPEDVASGDVTFTFTFSEPVSGFGSDDIDLAGGDKGTFTMVSDSVATLVAEPPTESAGTLEVSLGSGSFVDRAGNLNEVGASAEQAFEILAPPANPFVFDDFDDGDSSDWFFFGGNAAGGGGGVLNDRDGTPYLSTGWGGNGSGSVFYGGFVKNLPEDQQVTLPTDPWFNVWVLNQDNASVDGYTLEITLREDTDGNGWTDGIEDSIGLNTTFTSADFDNQWTLISAPLSSFFNKNTGGDMVFNGNLDEVVIVISGVAGGEGTTVEVDFDTIALSSGGPLTP